MERFKLWLERYADAWRAGDPDAVTDLFAHDAHYQEAPFSEPLEGSQAIRDYWAQAVRHSRRDVDFEAEALATGDAAGLAHWHAEFTAEPSQHHVALDGILMAAIDEGGHCTSFREWWHRLEDHAD